MGVRSVFMKPPRGHLVMIVFESCHHVDCGSDMIELDVDCLLFFPVEGTGSNPEWGDYSVVACCCVCMRMVVFGDALVRSC